MNLIPKSVQKIEKISQLQLADRYLLMKERIIQAGFAWEIDWQGTRSLSRLSEDEFLAESAWVILCSGMREAVVRQRYGAISEAFLEWVSADAIAEQRMMCEEQALQSFGHQPKVRAIGSLCEKVSTWGFDQILQRVELDGIVFLQSFDFIGPVTSLHLAKNIGLDVVKPDRHLMRMATAIGCSSPDQLCHSIADFTGDSVSVIDLVLWRYATLDPHYDTYLATGQSGTLAPLPYV